MTQAEAAKLLAVVAAAYASFDVDETKVQVWRELLGDLDLDLVSTAVRRHIAASKWAPTVAEIREEATRLSHPEQMTAGEAWGAVHEAVQRYGYYQPQESLESLPPLVAQAARQIGWSEICLETNVGVLRGQFMKVYQAMREREEREEVLPANIRLTQGRAGELEHIGDLQLAVDCPLHGTGEEM